MGGAWPTSAPTIPELDLALTELETADTEALAAEATVRVKRHGRRRKMTPAQGLVRRVDFTTDMLFGRDSARKLEFGLEPWGNNQATARRALRAGLRPCNPRRAGVVLEEWSHFRRSGALR